VIGALLVAISRTEDYRHHWQDVTIGAILGSLCAYFAYRQYYPSLAHASCQDPYLTRLAYCRESDQESLLPQTIPPIKSNNDQSSQYSDYHHHHEYTVENVELDNTPLVGRR
jgi:hypothetical protein